MKEWFGKKRNKFLLALIVNLSVLVFYLGVFFPAYESNDDSGLRNLGSGLFGVYDAHMIHQNYIFGLIYNNLYKLSHSVPWYAIVQYTMLLLAFTLITYCLLVYLEKPHYLGLIIPVLIVYGFEAYIRIQYTKTAGIVIAGGLSLVFTALSGQKIRKAGLLTGILMTVFGAMYRMEAFYCVTAIFSSLIIFLILSLRKNYEGNYVRRLAVCVLAGVILLGSVFGARKYDRMQYTSESWSYYVRFNDLRTELLDYGVPKYSEHKEEYQAMGFNADTIKFLRTWSFQDAEVFTVDSLQKVVDMKEVDKPTIDRAYIHGFLSKFYKGLRNLKVFWCFLLITAFCLLWSKHSWYKWIAIMYEAAVILALNFFLYYRGRFMVHRVDVGIWIAAIMVLVIIFKPEKISLIVPAEIVMAIAVFAFCMHNWQGDLRIHKTKAAERIKKERALIEEIHADKEHLYLKKIGTIGWDHAYGVFDDPAFGMSENAYSMGSWSSQSECVRSVLDGFDISNPLRLREVIDNDRVYIVDNRIKLTERYLRYWYNKDARGELVKTIGKYKVYRIVSK